MKKDFVVLNTELEKASKKLKNTRKKRVEFADEIRQTSRDFYFRLSILCAGIISLTVTYIGYLANLQSHTIILAEMLILGWILLLVSILGSLYTNHFHSVFLHYQLQKMDCEAHVNEEEKVIALLTLYPRSAYNAQNIKDIKQLIKAAKSRKAEYKEFQENNEKKEKHYEKLWEYSRKSAHYGFVIGIILIVAFAIINLPVEYRLLNGLAYRFKKGFSNLKSFLAPDNRLFNLQSQFFLS